MVHKLIKNGFSSGRRVFLKSMTIVTSMVIVGTRITVNAYAEVKDYLTSRIAAIYKHDEAMRYRKSQDNPMVKKLYSECMSHPMCEKSEKYLHSQYTNRSAGIDKIRNF
ncbi:iron hydrogenase small subunit [bacterium]|nr:iron hydrogenase small subunit [bacterium]